LKSNIEYYVEWWGVDVNGANESGWYMTKEGTVNLGGLSVGLGLHLWF